MLYLEDYLELIEHLPQELCDRLTYIRESDLKVNNSNSRLEARVKQFFAEAKKLSPEERQCECNDILEEYEKTMKYADDKVNIAAQTHEIMIKLIQKLDGELEKFKLELEADHAGITEELERRSLELDSNSRLDNLINDHLSQSSNMSQLNQCSQFGPTAAVLKDRRKSEHKNRHYPYQNNHNNGYEGRAKLSKDHSHNSLKHNAAHGRIRHGSKNAHLGDSLSRQHSRTTSPVPYNSNMSISSAPGSVVGEINGYDGYYSASNLTSTNNPGFKSTNPHPKSNSQIEHHHSALSVALSSATNTLSPSLNSISTLSSVNSPSVQNKISNSGLKSTDLIDSDSPLVRQNPLAAAASQAIAATQQLQHGRRTPSLKASFAAINAAGLGPHMDTLNPSNKQDILSSGVNRNALAPMAPDQQSLRFNPYSKINSNGGSNQLYMSVTKSGRATKRPRHHASHLYPDESPTSISSDNSVFENSESLSSTDFVDNGTTIGSTSPSSLDFGRVDRDDQSNTTLYQRDETKYCICRQISYGEMVACDNEECEFEWFHYDCVGITQPPKGKWYCPDCTRRLNSHHSQQQQNHQTQPQKKRGRKEKSVFNLVNSVATEKEFEQPKSIV